MHTNYRIDAEAMGGVGLSVLWFTNSQQHTISIPWLACFFIDCKVSFMIDGNSKNQTLPTIY